MEFANVSIKGWIICSYVQGFLDLVVFKRTMIFNSLLLWAGVVVLKLSIVTLLTRDVNMVMYRRVWWS